MALINLHKPHLHDGRLPPGRQRLQPAGPSAQPQRHHGAGNVIITRKRRGPAHSSTRSTCGGREKERPPNAVSSRGSAAVAPPARTRGDARRWRATGAAAPERCVPVSVCAPCAHVHGALMVPPATNPGERGGLARVCRRCNRREVAGCCGWVMTAQCA